MQQKVLNNRYELEQRIGEGGMARVYRGRDLRLNRRVAVKVLHAQYATDPGFLGRFNHEAQAAANLRHPNIVDVYDVGQDGDIQYIVMEFVDGQDLKSVLRTRGALPIEEAVAIAEEVAEGLDAAHRAGLVHRDIKPQNIIIDSAGRVKITDFGIAKSMLSTSVTETGVIFGTADYLSPEQARGHAAVPASDVYSLGISLYEMLTGRLPFSGENSIAVAMQHLSAEPTPPSRYNPRIPPQLETIVLSALDKDANRRPQTARAFAQMLRDYRTLGDQGTVVRPMAPRPPARQQQPQAQYPQPQYPPRQRPNQSTGTTAQRSVPVPPRTPTVAEPPRSSGMGFGGFLLGLLLISGVLGLIYLFATGAFEGLLPTNIGTGGTGGTVDRPTPTLEEPTAQPTGVPLVQVPNVQGLSQQDAINAIVAARLNAREDPPRNDPNVPSGQVIDQLPLAGSQITETATVTFAVSLGPELVEVPDVSRVSQTFAQQQLEQAGFVVTSEVENSTVDEGFVIRQSPSAGLRVPRGETVTIFVSDGNRVTMPDVFGLSETEARRLIAEAGLFVSFVDAQGPDKIPNFDQIAPGTVVSSEPRGGDRVQRGSAVTLGVRAP